jgi:hypothetical protein
VLRWLFWSHNTLPIPKSTLKPEVEYAQWLKELAPFYQEALKNAWCSQNPEIIGWNLDYRK